MSILSVRDLKVTFKGKKHENTIVKGMSFDVDKGKCLCIVGESGSGKSMAMKAIMGLLDKSFKLEGEAYLEETNLLTAPKETLRQIRGQQMTMILQNPMTCFDGLYRIGYQMEETFKAHTKWSKEERYKVCIDTLKQMHIHEPEEVMKKYPHQLSGGMLQRIMIGIALALNPKILIADEPTTAIDTITQLEIMKAFVKLKEQGVTMLFITHDLGVASMIADEVIVVNKGEIVDRGSFEDIKTHAVDPYTRDLITQKQAVTEAYKKCLEGIAFD